MISTSSTCYTIRCMVREKRKKKDSGEDFSHDIKTWLDSDQPKTLLSLDKVFGNRTFAILFMFLMASSALPIPTAGVTDLFAILSVIFGAQMALGRKTLWLPRRWEKLKLNKTLTKKILPSLVKMIGWLEKFSKPRWSFMLKGKLADSMIGVGVAFFAAATIAAPPFSGLDTLPALGVVLISIGMILKDGLITAIGFSVGISGIMLQFFLGKAVVKFIHCLF
jgi:hypothetical protein